MGSFTNIKLGTNLTGTALGDTLTIDATGGTSTYFRRDDLVAVGGESGINLSQTPLSGTISIVRTRSGVSYELLASEFTLIGTTISLTTGINAADVCIVRYASEIPITVASDFTSAVTWNPLDKSPKVTLSGGNLTYTHSGTSGNDASCRANVGKSSGKWYWECLLVDKGIGSSAACAAIATPSATLLDYIGSDAYGWSYLDVNGWIYHGGVGGNWGASPYTTGDVVNIALDMDNGKVWFGKNGVWQGAGDPVAGTGPAFSSITGTVYPACGSYDNGAQITARFAPASWGYPPPSGFTALTP